MVHSLKASIIVALVLPLTACVEDTGSSSVAPGRATMAEVEQACVSRLARESMVDTGLITVMNSTGSSEGSAVFLRNADGGSWTCRADGAGNITSMEFGGGNL